MTHIDLDFFRTEYIGKNMGVPTEFLAYERRPYWNFDDALSCALLHGILPRPNDIEYPLELMSQVWKIFDAFPIANSVWMPYWKNNVSSSSEKVKISYYKYTSLDDKSQLLAFVVNTSVSAFSTVRKYLEEKGLSFFEAQVSMVPQNKITLSDEDLVKFNKLVAALEDLDDVQNVYHNVDLPDEEEEE
jgi:hypothetical protein